MAEQQTWLALFERFLKEIRIDSKETGVGPLNPYESQKRFLHEIATGLEDGVHDFICLKARQLGISTMSLAIDLFWLFAHPGLQGALVTDTEDNRDKFRVILNRYLESLPKSWRVQTRSHNRGSLVLSNGSVLDYVVAGIKKGKGALGRSRAWNFVHATECSSYGDQAAIDSMIASLAQNHPDRLYIFESTARGPNAFCEMWDTAEGDPTKRRFFIGWWAKEGYAVRRSDKRFAQFMADPLSDFEREMIRDVKRLYQVTVADEQICWWRWYRETHISSDAMMDQEFPWTADQAFVVTGKIFFPPKRIMAEIKRVNREVAFKGFRYHVGENFRATTLEQVRRDIDAELRVFEEPVATGVYAIGVDPAYGQNEYKDSHTIEILRCYADRTLQVAELATPDIETYQLTWMLAHLAGAYRNCIINLEIIGPGATVMTEFRHLKQLVLEGQLDMENENGQWTQVLSNARWYMYNKPDSMGSGYVYNWKCLALDTHLPTPDGWTTMGEVASGDRLIDDRGLPCTVRGVSPVYLGKPCYRLTFDDESSIVADAEHLWSVHRHLAGWRGGREALRKTTELVAGNHVIRVADSLDLPPVDLPIHPYVLGVWLGDGASAAGCYYASGDDIGEIGAHLKAAGAALGKAHDYGGVCHQTILGLKSRLEQANLLNNKHIPPAYLRASRAQRQELLQGLMDTDGSSGGNGGRQCSFTTSSPQLAQDFAELIRTLGFKAKSCVRNRSLKYAGGQSACEPAYQFWFTASTKVFKLARKQSRIDAVARRSLKHWHRIVSIEPVPSVPVRCVIVDSASHLYLAGRGMIPTHNTNSDNKQMIMNKLRDEFSQSRIRIQSRPALREMEKVVQDGAQIMASGSGKDDRVFALALAIEAYTRWLRPSLITQGQTYAQVQKQEEERNKRNPSGMVPYVVQDFFKRRDSDRYDRYIRELENY